MDYAQYVPIILGWTGSVLLIISFLSQLYSIQRSGQVDNISYIFILLQLVVNLMFFIYDIYIWSYPLMVSNGTVAFLLVVMSIQKIYFTSRNRTDVNKPLIDVDSDEQYLRYT
jgi:uncharacterized protein with PQ loop repeat